MKSRKNPQLGYWPVQGMIRVGYMYYPEEQGRTLFYCESVKDPHSFNRRAETIRDLGEKLRELRVDPNQMDYSVGTVLVYTMNLRDEQSRILERILSRPIFIVTKLPNKKFRIEIGHDIFTFNKSNASRFLNEYQCTLKDLKSFEEEPNGNYRLLEKEEVYDLLAGPKK